MLSVSIQAGGNSRRMGQDKALAPFLGRPLIQRVIERISPIADEIFVTTNRLDDFQFLGLPLYPDLWPSRGALGGLLTALSSARYEVVAVVACDMPFASAAVLQFAHNLITREKADVAIPKSENGLEPLHAVYRRETCLPAVETAISGQNWRLISWFPDVKVRLLQPDIIKRLDPSGLTFLNLNTPEEFSEAEKKARQV